jgi:hypothetical protein
MDNLVQSVMEPMRLPRQLSSATAALLINVAGASFAAEDFISVPGGNGERIGIERSSVRLTPIYKGPLFAELKMKENSNLSARLKYEECKSSMDAFYCWKMYGDEISASRQQVPDAILKVPSDPLYVIVSYKPIFVAASGQRRLGEESFVVCLNPGVPSGYWASINQYKPILKNTPFIGVGARPLDLLRSKACSSLAKFER